MRPGPWVISRPLDITIGNIANPASKATIVSKEATITHVFGIEISLDKYDPYTIKAPMPRLKLKKA